jgi:hypothetical protein
VRFELRWQRLPGKAASIRIFSGKFATFRRLFLADGGEVVEKILNVSPLDCIDHVFEHATVGMRLSDDRARTVGRR